MKTPLKIFSLFCLISLSLPAWGEEGAAPSTETPPVAESSETSSNAAPAENSETTEAPAASSENNSSASADAAAASSGEDEKENAAAGPTAPAADNADKAEKKTGLAKLMRKLTRKDGKPVPIAVLTPLDYTTLNFVDTAQETILAAIARYGEFDIRSVPYSPNSLTLEEFRKVVTKYKVDVVILSVLKPTNFDLFLYDRRTPYAIYAHSETLPEELQYQLTKETVEEYSKVIVRRTLYAYMQDQSYELPREEVQPLLNVEIPRWIASGRNLAMLNRELLSRYYVSLGAGAALTSGTGSLWNANMVSFEAGLKLIGDLYVEAAVDMFSYNAFIGSIKYLHQGKDHPFRFLVGIGGAILSNSRTLNWDQTFALGSGGTFIVPSFTMMLPIVEVFFKVETKLMIDPSFKKMAFTLMPGLFVQF